MYCMIESNAMLAGSGWSLDKHPTARLPCRLWWKSGRQWPSVQRLLPRYIERQPRDVDQKLWRRYPNAIEPCIFPMSSSDRSDKSIFTNAVRGLGADKIRAFSIEQTVASFDGLKRALPRVLLGSRG